MRTTTAAAGLLMLGLAVSACGGGGSGTSMGSSGLPGVPPVATATRPPVIAPTMAPMGTPTIAPTSAPTTTGQAGDAKPIQAHGQTIWADAKSGLALYTFDGDTTPNQSTCTGTCLAIWPSHVATSSETGTNNFTIFTRPDGSLQWAYKGKPLYTFASDTPANNATGDGFQNFRLAHP
ncbi:MAG: COG4315 family predicted lipoprotein [Vulcanimicrobiaceae bacterium]